jgi:hypothetical protein
MTSRIPENFSTWVVDWSLVTIMGNTMPPRDPNDDDDEEEEDEDGRTKTSPTNRRSCANRTMSSTATAPASTSSRMDGSGKTPR